ncbi:cytidylyltransferase domain-containing protein [Paenibacillus montaniterrae]|uniref:cytidylyltransferase domain-containing protein n=1 Tax=Paenibacillus montaniterrae TaxID=429341 RepID=UPI001BD0441B|nr:glycosyltransferase family protein [Paenibacillus montaniterrae]
MNVIVIIQARMGSKRLPGKVLKKLGSTDALNYCVKRCSKIKGVSDVIIATSNLSQDDAIVQWCKTYNVKFFRGSEEDVLERYVQCACTYNPKYVIRVTADCPFVDYEMASGIVDFIKQQQVDIVDLGATLPRGLAVEAISYSALQYIDQHGQEPRHREHVTYYAYEYKDQFTRATYQPPKNRLHPELRITLDTEEDYTMLAAVAQHFNDPYIPSSEVIKYLLEHPEIAALNAHVEQKPVI